MPTGYAAAIQNMFLAACAMGLRACWVGALREEMVEKVLETPNGVRPVAFVPVGHLAEKPRTPPKRLVGEIVHYGLFQSRKSV